MTWLVNRKKISKSNKSNRNLLKRVNLLRVMMMLKVLKAIQKPVRVKRRVRTQASPLTLMLKVRVILILILILTATILLMKATLVKRIKKQKPLMMLKQASLVKANKMLNPKTIKQKTQKRLIQLLMQVKPKPL